MPMKPPVRRSLALALALALATGLPIAAQDHDHEHDAQGEELEQVHQRMLELMGKVENRLKAIDELLNDASARDKSAGGAAEVQRVLVTSRERAQQNIDDIDEILRLSMHPHPPPPPGSPAGGT